MEHLTSLSIKLNEFIKSSTTECAIDEINHHLNNLELFEDVNDVVIPDGLAWFGVSQPLTKRDFDGRIVVLDFFTYCCMNCIHILPHLKALEEKYKENKTLLVVGVHSPKFENEKNVLNLQNAIVKLNISHPVVNDPETVLWSLLDITCWPTLLILGPTGKPILTLIGEGHERVLNIFVEVALDYYASKLNPSSSLPLCATRLPVASRLLSYPAQVAVGPNGRIAVTDSGHHRVVLVSPSGQILEVIGGPNGGFKDGSLAEARFRDPQGLTFYGQDNIFVADTGNHTIRLVDFVTKTVTTVVGTAQQGTDNEGGELGPKQPICSPWGLCIVPTLAPQNYLPLSTPSDSPSFPPPPPISSPTLQNNLHLSSPSTPPAVSPPSLPPPPPMPPNTYSQNNIPSDPPVSPNASSSSASLPPNIPTLPPPPPNFPTPPCPPFAPTSPLSPSDDTKKDVLLIAMSGAHQIWGYFLEDSVWWKGRLYRKGSCAALVGSGSEENRNNRYPRAAGLAQPSGLCYSPSLQAVFIADSESSSVRRLCLRTGAVSGVVGGHLSPDNLFSFGDKDGVGTSAQLQHPLDVAWDCSTNSLLVVDSYNHKLKMVDVATRQCTTLPLKQPLHEPGGVCVDGGVIYIADTNSHCLLKTVINDFNVTEIELKLQSTQCGKSKIRRVWGTSFLVAPTGSEVTLTVCLSPAFSGRWVVAADSPSNIVMSQRSGIVEAGRLQVIFFSNTQDEVAFDIDLIECRDDACFMRYYRLLARPVLSEDALEKSSVCFSPAMDR